MSDHTSHTDKQITTASEVISDTRILIVDDDDILRGLHEAVLSLAGYGTQSASDGKEALALVAIDDFDLIITDGRMPQLDGIGLIRALRAMGNRIPIIMVSATLNEGQLPDDVAREISAALPKPAGTGEILAAINHVLRHTIGKPPKAHITDIFPHIAGSRYPRRTMLSDVFRAVA